MKASGNGGDTPSQAIAPRRLTSIPVGTLDRRPWPEERVRRGRDSRLFAQYDGVLADTQSLPKRFYDHNGSQFSALNQLEVFAPLLLLLALLKRER